MESLKLDAKTLQRQREENRKEFSDFSKQVSTNFMVMQGYFTNMQASRLDKLISAIVTEPRKLISAIVTEPRTDEGQTPPPGSIRFGDLPTTPTQGAVNKEVPNSSPGQGNVNIAEKPDLA
ncbi:hypothetical protein CFC21_027841 [Triticum aestivum]|uniref:Uncharacterized protein n=2 Tax=Triticum aestivum TaxID=4565 RepID=A0A3B6D6Y2_WHEAT|nr:hypothetical protein CFC21_027841 [Triticum aestivum]